MIDLILFRYALKDMLRPKKLIAAAVLVAVPAALGLLLKSISPEGRFRADIAYNMLASSLVFGFVLIILSVVFGTGIISQEIEQKTIVYLLTRPVPRWRIVLMKFLAAVVVTSLTVIFASVAVALVAYGPTGFESSTLRRDLLILPIGALAYSSLFLLLATLLNRPLMYGLMFAFGWESWVPLMPGNFQKLSIMTYLRALAPHEDVSRAPRGITDLLSMLNPQTISTSLASTVLTLVTGIALLAALTIFSRNEYVPREDAE